MKQACKISLFLVEALLGYNTSVTKGFCPLSLIYEVDSSALVNLDFRGHDAETDSSRHAPKRLQDCRQREGPYAQWVQQMQFSHLPQTLENLLQMIATLPNRLGGGG